MKKKQEKQIVKEIQENKKRILNVIVASVFLAIAVNLLVFGVTEITNLSGWWYIISALGIFATILVGYLIIALKANNKKIQYKGFFIYTKDKKIVSVPNYEISEDMSRNMKAAFFENKAMEKIWKDGEIGGIGFEVVGVKKDKKVIAKANPAIQLLVELFEYCILEKLSTFLEDYFNRAEGKYVIKTYEREELTEFLLKNRFVKLFSEPMENRAAFIQNQHINDSNEKAPRGRVIAAYGEGGAQYNIFEFDLPEKTKISRKNNALILDMTNFVLEIRILYGGFGTVLPVDFFKYYLGVVPSFKNYHDYQFNIEIKVKQKFKALFNKVKWIEYDWIDGFIEVLGNYLDKDTFFNNIDWDKLQAKIRVEKNLLIEMKDK